MLSEDLDVAYYTNNHVASSPGGRNDRLVYTVMRMRLISEKSRKIVYSCPRPQNGGTEGDLNKCWWEFSYFSLVRSGIVV